MGFGFFCVFFVVCFLQETYSQLKDYLSPALLTKISSLWSCVSKNMQIFFIFSYVQVFFKINSKNMYPGQGAFQQFLGLSCSLGHPFMAKEIFLSIIGRSKSRNCQRKKRLSTILWNFRWNILHIFSLDVWILVLLFCKIILLDISKKKKATDT